MVWMTSLVTILASSELDDKLMVYYEINYLNYNIIAKMNIYRKAFHLVKVSQGMTKSLQIMKVPVRLVHARGYNEHFDDYSFKFHECNFALINCKETN